MEFSITFLFKLYMKSCMKSLTLPFISLNEDVPTECLKGCFVLGCRCRGLRLVELEIPLSERFVESEVG